MLKSKFFNYFFIVMFLGSLTVLSGCTDDDDEEDRLRLQIINNQKKFEADTKTALELAEGNTKVALELAVRNAEAAKLAFENAAAELATLVAENADAAEIAAAKDKKDALKREFDDAAERLSDAVEKIATERTNLANQLKLANEREAERVRIQHHDNFEDHDAAHKTLVTAQTEFNEKKTTLNTTQTTFDRARTILDSANLGVNTAQTAFDAAPSNNNSTEQTDLDNAKTAQGLAQTAFDNAETALNTAQTAFDDAKDHLDAAILAVR